jgi:hypothetical protein
MAGTRTLLPAHYFSTASEVRARALQAPLLDNPRPQ